MHCFGSELGFLELATFPTSIASFSAFAGFVTTLLGGPNPFSRFFNSTFWDGLGSGVLVGLEIHLFFFTLLFRLRLFLVDLILTTTSGEGAAEEGEMEMSMTSPPPGMASCVELAIKAGVGRLVVDNEIACLICSPGELNEAR